MVYSDKGYTTYTYLGAAMTWDNAGNLASIQKGSNPFLPSTTSSVTYTYLANGQRRTKTVGNTTTTYRYNNGLLLSQTTGTGLTAETLSFTYDADGKPVSITYKQGSNAAVTYFYAYNGQGDVIAIYNSSNSTLVGSYEYDLWGKLISVTPASSSSDPKGILTKNPFRYRGYYYDNETGYYYLNARYYDPQVRRFISADDMAYLGADGSITGFNLFAYCDNNSVNGYDDNGTLSGKNIAKLALGAAFLAGAIALTVATGGGAAVVAVGVAKVVGSVALSTAVGAGIGYLQNGKDGAIDGACNGFLLGSFTAFCGAGLKYVKVKGIGVHKGGSKSKVFMTGTEGEEELARLVGGKPQQYRRTSLGGRYIDQLADNIAHESKVGYTTLTKRIRTQILKDAELINNGTIEGAHWHFFTSGVTGKGGASQPLLDFLTENGILYTIH